MTSALPSKAIDVSGKTFGRLRVLSFVEVRKGNSFWDCLCECGNKTQVTAGNLRNGTVASCGCLKKEVLLRRCKSHGMAGTPVYRRWVEMLTRVRNPNRACARNYSGRGIGVCDEWRDFTAFYRDMGDLPTPKHTLERVDNDKGYCPENCVWATAHTQARNKRSPVRDLPPGVYRVRDRFVVRLGLNGKSKHIGVFDSVEEAAHARKLAEKQYW